MEAASELQVLRDMGHRFIQGLLLAHRSTPAPSPGSSPATTTTPS